jgi:hypothetical protein
MKSLKISIEENADFAIMAELLIQIKGIKSVEIIDYANSESDFRKVVTKSKEQLKQAIMNRL